MNTPFDEQRDPVLGARLTELLAPRDADSFTSRVLGQLGRQGNSWEVLASWARPGIAAGLLLASLLGYWLVVGHRTSAPAASELLASDQQFERDGIAAVVLGSRR